MSNQSLRDIFDNQEGNYGLSLFANADCYVLRDKHGLECKVVNYIPAPDPAPAPEPTVPAYKQTDAMGFDRPAPAPERPEWAADGLGDGDLALLRHWMRTGDFDSTIRGHAQEPHRSTAAFVQSCKNIIAAGLLDAKPDPDAARYAAVAEMHDTIRDLSARLAHSEAEVARVTGERDATQAQLRYERTRNTETIRDWTAEVRALKAELEAARPAPVVIRDGQTLTHITQVMAAYEQGFEVRWIKDEHPTKHFAVRLDGTLDYDRYIARRPAPAEPELVDFYTAMKAIVETPGRECSWSKVPSTVYFIAPDGYLKWRDSDEGGDTNANMSKNRILSTDWTLGPMPDAAIIRKAAPQGGE